MQNKQKLPKKIKNQKKVKVGKFAHFRSHATLCGRKFYSGLLYLNISKNILTILRNLKYLNTTNEKNFKRYSRNKNWLSST